LAFYASELTKQMTNTATANSTLRHLVSAHTMVETNGQSAAFELGSLAVQHLLLVLRVEEILEQESLHVAIWGSADGQDWGTQALFWFPQKFYRGIAPAALDLRQRPDIKFLQARWEVNRWGRGIPRPFFRFAVEVQEAGS
jgi:hypothetical protein